MRRSLALPPGMPFPDMLFRVTSPRFCAGLTVAHDFDVTACAPVLRRRFAGTNLTFVRATCEREGWTLEHVP